jgi:hypothetical protein
LGEAVDGDVGQMTSAPIFKLFACVNLYSDYFNRILSTIAPTYKS